MREHRVAFFKHCDDAQDLWQQWCEQRPGYDLTIFVPKWVPTGHGNKHVDSGYHQVYASTVHLRGTRHDH